MDAGTAFDQTFDSSYRGLQRLIGPLADRLAPHVHANWISGIRPPLAALIIWLLYGGYYWTAFAIYTPTSLLDALDGPVARRRKSLNFNDDEKFGAFFDAASDKFFLLPFLFLLPYWSQWDSGIVAMINVAAALTIGVELALLAIRTHDYLRDSNGHPAGRWGKVKLWVESLGAGGFVLSYPAYESWTAIAGSVLLFISVPMALRSLWDKFHNRKRRS